MSDAGRRFAVALSDALVLAAVVASVLALWAGDWWFAELAVHFRVQYVAVAILALAVAALARRTRLAVLALALLGLNTAGIAALLADVAAAPAVIPAGAGEQRSGLRIATANVLFLSSDHARVRQWVEREDPDVAIFVEATTAWKAGLQPLREQYAYAVETGVTGRRGVLVMSRLPLEPARSLFGRGEHAIALRTSVTVGGRVISIIAAHATWPLGPGSARARTRDLDRLAAEATKSSRGGTVPLLLAGDLNVSPFSPHFANLLHAAMLRSAVGSGWLPTWPIQFMPAGIQIDHVLVSAVVQVRGVRRGPAVGSDHLPLVADLQF